MSRPDERKSKRGVGPMLRGAVSGIVSGASDNDPTTVATLAVVGATTVYSLSWLVLLVIPMLAVVQAVASAVAASARIGLEAAVVKRSGRPWALVALVAVLAVNLLTLAADTEAGAAALSLITGIDFRWFVAPLVVLIAVVMIYGNFERIKQILIYMTALFFAYIVAAILARPDWHALALSLIPHVHASHAFFAGAIAILGTTLTAYAYVWQNQEVVEEHPSARYLGMVQATAMLGIVVAGITFFFILLATAATLGVHHQSVQTAQQAAQALAPFAGHYASLIFGIGLLGSALLALPVLAGSSAYFAGQMFGWRGNLDARPHNAPRFYAVLIGSLAFGAAVALLGIPAIGLLFWSGVVGGFATPITLVLMLLVATDARTMRGKPIGRGLACAGWIVTAIVTLSIVAFLIDLVKGA